MSFSSLTFLCSFLPLAMLMYLGVPASLKKGVLVVLSLLFYAWGEPIYGIGLLVWIYSNHMFGSYIAKAHGKKRKVALFHGIVFHLFFLLYFKYYGGILSLVFHSSQFTMPAQPLGLSFILFSTLSFLIDVYRKEGTVGSLLDTACYISFFPKLIMGPIEPYRRFIKQIGKAQISWENIDKGAKLFVLGLAQKVILADTFHAMQDTLMTLPSSFLTSWQDAFTYTLQIYFDFQGYSMMAAGLACMLGYTLMKNFDDPYSAISIQDFWHRWHRSLSQWFRDYVYIPLGGSRVSAKRHIINLFVVWILTGLWHGSTLNFVIWGLYYGTLLVIEKYAGSYVKKHVPISIRKLLTFLLVVFGWVIFANTDIHQAGTQIATMLHLNGTSFYTEQGVFYLCSYLGYFLLGFALCSPSLRTMFLLQWRGKRYEAQVHFFGYLMLFILALCFIVSSGFQSFLYVQF